jgi:hypothetical protein
MKFIYILVLIIMLSFPGFSGMFNTDSGIPFTQTDLNLSKKYKLMASINTSLSATGTILIFSGIIMGLIPYDVFPDYMKAEDQNHPYGIYYPYMTAYASVGISLFLSGTLMLVICFPFMIYGFVKLYLTKQNEKVSFSGFPFEIRIKLS